MKASYYTHMGNDDMVVDMARASFAKQADDYSADANSRLIHFLARGMSQESQTVILEEAANTDDHEVLLDCFKRMKAQLHWAPFAHPQITMFLEVPIFVARQDFKHIVGFVRSETSRRYVDDIPEFFVPEIWRSRPEGSVKQGSSDQPVQHHKYIEDKYAVFLNAARETYEAMLEANVAPEQARMVLPQSMYTSYYVTGSLAAWARAYKQRIDLHAQQEIQDLAKQWDAIIRPLFPVSWSALVNG